MKTRLLFILLIICSLSTRFFAHDASNDIHHFARTWVLKNSEKPIMGYFSYCKGNFVFIETKNHRIQRLDINQLTDKDKQFVKSKQLFINKLNNKKIHHQHSKLVYPESANSNWSAFLLIFGITLFSIALLILPKFQFKYSLFFTLPLIVFSMVSWNNQKDVHEKSITDPQFLDDAFTPFKPAINTLWDDQYFYVESKGIPLTHEMMVGISSHGWQQQVPIPQCYIGTNAWQIPLNPVLSSSPIPVDSIHFTRGAIAIAINGVPIFNPHTNTGVDSYLDGQLDNYGGHCGRADDYHYHIAPLHLYNYTSATKPIAFGLDGFAVYGATEPSGGTMQTLDENHGHLGSNGVYHYHGTTEAPYMIGRMAGQVTEDTTHQLIPQPKANPIRPSLTPLNGALITACIPNQTNNGYKLIYTINGQTDSIIYNWTSNGVYTYNFYTSGNGVPNTQTYNDFIQCEIVAATNSINKKAQQISIYPNPATDYINLSLNELQASEIIGITLCNAQGKIVLQSDKWINKIPTSNLKKGIYILKIDLKESTVNKQVIIN